MFCRFELLVLLKLWYLLLMLWLIVYTDFLKIMLFLLMTSVAQLFHFNWLAEAIRKTHHYAQWQISQLSQASFTVNSMLSFSGQQN